MKTGRIYKFIDLVNHLKSQEEFYVMIVSFVYPTGHVDENEKGVLCSREDIFWKYETTSSNDSDNYFLWDIIKISKN